MRPPWPAGIAPLLKQNPGAMTWKPPALAPLPLLPLPPPPQKGSPDEIPLPGAHELESDSAFWALHDEVQVLGKGSYGTVKLARVKSNNNLVAVKAVTKGASPPQDGIDERREAEALLLLRHANSNTAPARIGGRKARFSRHASRVSIADLQDEMRRAEDPSDVQTRRAASAAIPTARRSATLDASASGLRRRGSRTSDSMDVWQLQAALRSGGPTGEAVASERETSCTADTDTAPSTTLAADAACEAVDDDSSDMVRLLDVYESPGTLFLVMRVEGGGDLAARLAGLSGGRCAEDEARMHASALFRAIAGMHAKGIVHRDIKPSNVMLSQEGEGRLGDFGLAERLPTDKPPLLTAVCGTHNNMAPEMIRCGHGDAPGYGTPADMWQMGLLVYEMLFGQHPIARDTDIETLAAILAADWTFPPGVDVSAEAKDLITSLLVSDPAKRPSATECLQHPWLCMAM
ncbi:hypothetical protein AB1Y20_009022 [Prymnesium parvum]|uniref:Protein kinase domain-containing protein n=1 Tax=Prymnesium parvum TaxID=97485 RepID=A0AB34K3N0_PRYPA